jgi:hypothetical protein
VVSATLSTCSLLKKAIHGFFNIVIRKAWFSNDPHFQWLTATENAGTSMYREQQAARKQRVV